MRRMGRPKLAYMLIVEGTLSDEEIAEQLDYPAAWRVRSAAEKWAIMNGKPSPRRAMGEADE